MEELVRKRPDPATMMTKADAVTSLLTKEQPRVTTLVPPESKGFAVTPGAANNYAHSEHLIDGEQLTYNQRVSLNQSGQGAFDSSGAGTIENSVINDLRRQVSEGLITDEIGLDTIMELSPEKKTERVNFAITKADLSKATHHNVVMYSYMSAGLGDRPASEAQGVYERLTGPEIETLRTAARTESQQLLRYTRDMFVASHGIEGFGAVLDGIGQELIPFYNVASKIGLSRTVMDAMKIPTEDQPVWLLGEQRKVMREAFGAMSDPEKQEAMSAIVKAVTDLESDPAMGPLIRQFGVLELFEATFTDGVLSGSDTDVAWDRFWGNFESAAEGLFSVLVLFRHGGKGLKSIWTASDASTATNAARHTANRQFQARAQEAFSDEVAKEMGLDPAEIALSNLHRPSEFIDDRTVGLPGIRELSESLDRQESVILQAHQGRFDRVFNDADRAATRDKAKSTLDLGDRAVVAPSMSVSKELEDGVQVWQVMAKNGEEGWSSFDDLVPDLTALDPRLEQLTILRRNSSNKLEKVDVTPDEFARMVVLDVAKMSDQELIRRSKNARPGSIEFLRYEREAAKRAGDTRSVDEILGDEFFLQWENFRAYHPTDKVAFGDTTLRNSVMPDWTLTPNARFGDELTGAFQESFTQQNRVDRLFEGMLKPFYNLNTKDKKVVGQISDWAEDFGKEHGVSPSLYDTLAQFPNATEAQQKGLMAVQRAMDTQYEVFNRRLYLEFNGLGYKTAKPLDPNAATYHGKLLDREEVKGKKTVYDPVRRESVQLDQKDIATLYNDGGGLMKLDSAIDIPGSNGTKQSTFVKVDGSDYKVTDLSTQPLAYYPGYRYRFYEDPYYVMKKTGNVEVDGIRSKGQETAFKTASSELEGTQWLNRVGTRRVVNGVEVYTDKDGAEFYLKRAKDLDQTDQTYRLKETLQRDGRLFWDSRNQERLANVNGNQAELQDFVKSLERGAALSSRQNLEEDILRAAKNAFSRDYANLLKESNVTADNMSEVVDALRKRVNNVAGAEAKKQIKDALGVAKYIRQLEGVDSAVVPWMRARVLETAVWTDRMLNKKGGFKPGTMRWVERKVSDFDPIRLARGTAFYAFMVFRPFRQAALQASQPLFLAGLDPAYVLSGKGLKDSLALSIAHTNYIKSGFDTGYSSKSLAKTMGLTQKEFKVLVTQFEKSGALDVVDVHSFAGGTSRFRKTSLPKETITSKMLYGVRSSTNAVVGALKKYGFDKGEGLNKIGTYNIAYRRVMKRNGYKSLTQLTNEDWKQVRIDTENLSLSMSRPNNAAYQSGFLSVTTQFLAFTHKVALAMLGQNPALKGKDVVKLWASGFTLFGANMIGLRDWTRESLTGIGMGEYLDQELPGMPGATVTDLLSAGLIQTTVNKMMETPLDTESFTPVLNINQFVEMTLGGIIENPAQGMLGPFGNRASALLEGWEFMRQTMRTDMPAADMLVDSADMYAKKLFPQFNDLTLAYLGYKHGRLYHASGESIDLQPTWLAMVARGVFGARTVAEMQWYELQDDIKKNDEIVLNMQMGINRFLKQQFFLYRDGELDRDSFQDIARWTGILAKMAPDGRRMEVIKGAMLSNFDDNDPSKTPIAILAEAITSSKLTPAQAKDYVNQLITDPQQQKKLEQWIDDSLDERILNDAEMQQRVITNNPNIRD